MDMIRSKYSEAFRALSKKAVFSSAEGREAGIPPRMLAYFCQKGQIEKVSRGMYKIKDIDFDSAFEWGDLAYLGQVFPRMAASSRFQERQRQRRRAPDGAEHPIDHGLMPPGMGDCGLKDDDDLYGVFYPHNIWAVYADFLALEACEILNRHGEMVEDADIENLRAIYDQGRADLLASLERGAICEDGFRWIPGAPGKTSGSRWGVLNAFFPCGLLPARHELIEGSFRKIEENISPGGHPVHTGWMEDGCWVAISLDNLAEAHLARGNGDAAARYLYATLNHGTPLFTWCEERGQEAGTPKTSGDRQHLWTPVAVVRCLRDMLVMELDGGLHLALGAHRDWLASGLPLGVEHASTRYGDISYSLCFDQATRRVRGQIQFEVRSPLPWLDVHLRLPGGGQVVSLQTALVVDTQQIHEGFRWNLPQGALQFEAQIASSQ